MAPMLVCRPAVQAVAVGVLLFSNLEVCVCLSHFLTDCVFAYRTEWPGKVNSDEHAV